MRENVSIKLRVINGLRRIGQTPPPGRPPMNRGANRVDQTVSDDFVPPPPVSMVQPAVLRYPDLNDDPTWEASIRRDERNRITTALHAARFDGTESHATPDTFYTGIMTAISITQRETNNG